jgi:hypothetical protein
MLTGVMAPLSSGTPGKGTTVANTSSLNGVACPKTTVCDAVGGFANQSQVNNGVVVTAAP